MMDKLYGKGKEKSRWPASIGSALSPLLAG
jgi:hypothetical protein